MSGLCFFKAKNKEIWILLLNFAYYDRYKSSEPWLTATPAVCHPTERRHGPACRHSRTHSAAPHGAQAHTHGAAHSPTRGLRGAGAAAQRTRPEARHHRAQQPGHHRRRLPWGDNGAARQPLRRRLRGERRGAHSADGHRTPRAGPLHRGGRARLHGARRGRLRTHWCERNLCSLCTEYTHSYRRSAS